MAIDKRLEASGAIIPATWTEIVLLPSQKAEIHEILVERDFDPGRFHWDWIRSKDNAFSLPRVRYQDTDFGFVFAFAIPHGYVGVSPFNDRPFAMLECERWASVSGPDFEEYHHGAKEIFGEWLRWLKRELTAPDPWAFVQGPHGTFSSPDLSKLSSVHRFEPLSADEAATISQRLDEQRSQIVRECSLNADQVRRLDEKLEMLKLSMEGQRKEAWVHTALGAVVSLIIERVLTPTLASRLWNVIQAAFMPLLGG